jgi:S-layer homology domain
MRRTVLLAAASLFAVHTLAALDDPPGKHGPNRPSSAGSPDQIASVFGTSGLDIYTVSWSDFHPNNSASGYASSIALGYRWTTSGSQYMSHGLEGIPNGALVTQILWYFSDNNATSDFSGYLSRFWRESDAGGSPGGDTLSLVTSSGTPGDSVIFENLSYTLLRRFDVNSDGSQQVVNYVLFTSTPPFDGSIAISQVRILWQRQISPAPATSSFTDLAPTDFGFQQIEALAASGITSGCGGGKFCPNATMTRAQIAVFLAKALGLHWPAF